VRPGLHWQTQWHRLSVCLRKGPSQSRREKTIGSQSITFGNEPLTIQSELPVFGNLWNESSAFEAGLGLLDEILRFHKPCPEEAKRVLFPLILSMLFHGAFRLGSVHWSSRINIQLSKAASMPSEPTFLPHGLFGLVPASTIKQRSTHDQRQALLHSPPAPSPEIAPHSRCPRACTSPAYKPETAR
jgi:hypothetical protein